MSGTGSPRKLLVSKIHRDPRLQMRHRLDRKIVSKYATVYETNGAAMPPVEVVQTKQRLLLVDGYHRLAALESIGATRVEALVSEGNFKGLKLRLGREKLADDLAVIDAVRGAVGEDVKLMVDFNQGLNLGDALRRCHALDDQGLYWFEEPIAYNNLAGYAQLARELRTPIQLGENFYGPRALYQAIALGCGDYVMPDLMRIGGVTGWLRSAAIAGAAGIDMSTHLYPEFSAHLMRATETAHWLEWQDWGDPILAEPFAVSDGCLAIPDRPGAGIDWDEDAVRRYQYDA